MSVADRDEAKRRGELADDLDANKKRADKAAQDHALHWLCMVVVAGYAWQLHGLLVGIGTLVGLVAVICVGNMVILHNTGSLRLVHFNRWAWPIGTGLLLAITAAEICHIGTTC